MGLPPPAFWVSVCILTTKTTDLYIELSQRATQVTSLRLKVGTLAAQRRPAPSAARLSSGAWNQTWLLPLVPPANSSPLLNGGRSSNRRALLGDPSTRTIPAQYTAFSAHPPCTIHPCATRSHFMPSAKAQRTAPHSHQLTEDRGPRTESSTTST